MKNQYVFEHFLETSALFDLKDMILFKRALIRVASAQKLTFKYIKATMINYKSLYRGKNMSQRLLKLRLQTAKKCNIYAKLQCKELSVYHMLRVSTNDIFIYN